MARGENRIHEVELGSAPIERFRPLVSTQMWPELEGGLAGLKRRLDGHVLWNVNSTACGGGVAEMLASLIPYDRGAGIDERWAVVEGSPDFFNATKKIHTLLHGVEPDGGPLTAGERRVYEEATARNSEGLARLIRPGTSRSCMTRRPRAWSQASGREASRWCGVRTSESMNRMTSPAPSGTFCGRLSPRRPLACSLEPLTPGMGSMRRVSGSSPPASIRSRPRTRTSPMSR